MTLVNLAREELLWWMKNLKLCNGRKFQQQEPHMIIQQKAGGIQQGSFDRGEMIKGGEAFLHKCSKTSGIKICNANFHKEFVTLGHSCSSRQESCSGISLKDGW